MVGVRWRIWPQEPWMPALVAQYRMLEAEHRVD
jgi:hypothetical protein